MRDASSLFISDLHLASERPETTAVFFAFLDRKARNAGALYILGDLFEYWAGDDDAADPFNASICNALKRVAENGTRIFFIPGNRDFLAGPGFAESSGATVLDEPCLTTILGQPTLLLHGDILCSEDVEYARFRNEVRDPSWRASFLALPLAERKIRIGDLRRRSEREKQTKPAAIMDVNDDTVADLLRAHGYPRLIHGHTHRMKFYMHVVDGHRCERWVLGDWEGNGNYLACDSAGTQLHTFEDSAARK